MKLIKKILRSTTNILYLFSANKYVIKKNNSNNNKLTAVDSYWKLHTVNSKHFETVHQSLEYLKWRFSVYPLFKEFTGLYGNCASEVILDYGCGPGNDIIGFAIYSGAKKIIGMDVSEKSLRLTQHRLALHHIDPERINLIKISDATPEMHINNNSINHVNCQGVLMSTSHPELILKEFNRIMKPNSTACIMVYNENSLWFHLYTVYERMIIQGAFSGLNAHEAFSKNTDGEECPISRCYTPEQFASICQKAGFENIDYKGGYLSETELKSLHKYGQMALEDERLAEEHKEFLRSLVFDSRGLPLYRGKHAGIGGVYHLRKK